MRYPIGNPSITEQEIFEVTSTLREGRITQGESVARFERTLADYLKVSHVVVCSSGTSALHLALAALGIGPGDEVLVPNITFVATANAVRYVGATVVLVDVDPDTWNFSLADAAWKITARTRAMIPVHLYGMPCNMEHLCVFAENNGLFVVEDAAEAIGGSFNGLSLGTIGNCGTFSFYANKVITTGEGGAVATNDEYLVEYLRFLRGQAQSSRFYHTEVGFNYRLTDMQAAIGIAQMHRIDCFLEERRRIVTTYRLLLHDCLLSPSDVHAAPWLYTGLLPNGVSYSDVESKLEKHGIEVRPVFVPLNQLPMYAAPSESFPVSTYIAQQGISLPTYPGLSDDDVTFIAEKVLESC